jgi:AhpD family alkylhydroperoxidase
MFTDRISLKSTSLVVAAAALAIAAGALLVPSTPTLAEEKASKEEILAGVEQMFGFVPTFMQQMPRATLPIAVTGYTNLDAGETALPAKTKYLISLAVAAQIPCQYCVWADTLAAKTAGATDEEIGEAVGVAAMTRFWSTNFNGLQVDLATYQKELGPLFAGQ